MTVLFRFAIVFISIFIFSATHATDRSNDTAVLDVDASGEVDALTDGLLLLRSMFGLSDDALTTGVVSPDCVDCDASKISQYITSVEGKTYADLNSTDDQNISGSSFDGKTLTIGIENGQSETVDLSSLEDGTGITAEQAAAIEVNTAKMGITNDQANDIILNTAKVGISAGQANAIIANTAKVGITSDQIDAIEENSAKIGITIDNRSNTAAGTWALMNVTPEGSGNTAFGTTALRSNTTGSGNTGFGQGALGPNTTGMGNVAVGNAALGGSTHSVHNTGVGYGVLSSNRDHRNTAMGYKALYSSTQANANAAFGYLTMEKNIDGGYNSTLGAYSLQQNTTGHSNSAVGSAALESNTTGYQNTAVGAYSDVLSEDLTNATAIGHGAIVKASNTFQLGNESVTNVSTSGSITAGAITIPNSDGTNGQVLATDGSGTLSWTTKTGITSAQANQLSAAMTALNCISALAPPGDEDEEDEHGDDHGSTDYPEFWMHTQSCITDAFAGI